MLEKHMLSLGDDIEHKNEINQLVNEAKLLQERLKKVGSVKISDPYKQYLD